MGERMRKIAIQFIAVIKWKLRLFENKNEKHLIYCWGVSINDIFRSTYYPKCIFSHFYLSLVIHINCYTSIFSIVGLIKQQFTFWLYSI